MPERYEDKLMETTHILAVGAVILLIAICLTGFTGCSGPQVNKNTLIHDLAWDVGYIGYVTSPHTQRALIDGCEAFPRIKDPTTRIVTLIDVLSQVWSHANSPQGVALILVVNNLVGTLGLNLDQVTSSDQAKQIDMTITALCDGVKQATFLQTR